MKLNKMIDELVYFAISLFSYISSNNINKGKLTRTVLDEKMTNTIKVE